MTSTKGASTPPVEQFAPGGLCVPSNYVEAELQTVHLTTAQLAHRLNVSVKTVYNRRANGGELSPCINFMGHPRWRLGDIIAWEESQLEPMKGVQP